MTYPRLDVLRPCGVARAVFSQFGPGIGSNMVCIQSREYGLAGGVVGSAELIQAQAVKGKSKSLLHYSCIYEK